MQSTPRLTDAVGNNVRHESWLHRPRAHGRAHGAQPGQGRARRDGLRHAAGGRRCAGDAHTRTEGRAQRGRGGAGAAVKLCNNAAAHAYQTVVGEVLTLGMKAGVDLKTLTSVIGVSSGRSPTLTNAFPNRVFKREFTGFGFTAALAAKDLRLAA